MPQGRPWTGAEEIRLRKAIESGLTRVEICELIGREKDTIRRKCHKLGLTFPPTVRTFDYDDRVYEQPPSVISFATSQLGNAINALIERMDPRTVAECLGSSRTIIPGTERVRKTAEMSGAIATVLVGSRAA